MLKNYLRVALRNMMRSKVYTALTITGFAIGMASFLLIALWLRTELSYDRFHEKRDRIVMLAPEVYWGGKWQQIDMSPASYGHHMMRELPQLEATLRLRPWGRVTLEPEGGRKQVQNTWFADSTLFTVFSLELLLGEPGKVLAGPDEMALSQSVAKKLFGDENPIGKTIIHEEEDRYTVTGVFADHPEASHRSIESVISMETAVQGQLNGGNPEERWDSDFNYYTYALFKPGADPREFSEAIPGFLAGHMEADMAERIRVHQVALTDMHLRGDYSRIASFSLIAVMILVLASINFMNLATARSAGRAREIGVRKSMGGTRANLVVQFLGESLLIAGVAFGLALLLTELALPLFNQLTGGHYEVAYLDEPWTLLGLFAGALLVGLLAGLYPALYLSGFRPVQVLKAGASKPKGKPSLRKLLVVLQFSITSVMVIATLTVYSQIRYLQSKDLGFDKENLVYLTLFGNELPQQAFELKQEALSLPGVQGATVVSRVIGSITGGIWSVRQPQTPEQEALPLHAVFVDGDFVDLLDLQLTWGRNFNDQITTEREEAFLLNEAAVQKLGMNPEEDARLFFNGREGRVVGVLKDFNYKSLRYSSDPIIFKYPRNSTFDHRYVVVKLAPGDPASTLQALEGVWASFDPELDFEYRFADALLDRNYRQEARLGSLLSSFSLIALVVALLGMIGMALFTTNQRTKEIGVRKVLGATVPSVLRLLSWDFARPVLLANLIAWPVAWYLMSRWLENYAYRIEISLWLFAASTLAVMFLAWLAVAAQTLRAARLDPVKTLRYE